MDIVTGVQQIMIGNKCRSFGSALDVLSEIKNVGYEGIELNSFMIHKTAPIVKIMTRMAGMPIGGGGSLDWHSLINESGLKVISLHSDLGSLERDYMAVVQEAKSFGTEYVVITGMYRFDYGSKDEVLKLAERLNLVGEKLLSEGVHLLYHNHNCELQRIGNKRAFDILIEETNPVFVNFEFDSYWIAEAGAEPSAYMKKLGQRMVMWHINDRGCRTTGPYMTPILKEDAIELGYGNMDLDSMTIIAKQNGVKAIILEMHKNWINNNPVESLKKSASYLAKILQN